MKLPPPALITFDAFGTIYRPHRPVPEIYADHARQYGIQATPSQIETRFKDAFRSVAAANPNFGKARGWSDRDWWTEIICQVFRPLSVGQDVMPLATKLHDYFATGQAYVVYQDVKVCLQKLHEQGVQVGVLTNSDPRTLKVLQDLGITPLLGEPNDKVVWTSYETGYEKPNVEAFRAVERDLGLQLDSRARLWHVGDDVKTDQAGALAAGWNSIVLDRDATEPLTKIREGSFVVKDAQTLLQLFDFEI